MTHLFRHPVHCLALLHLMTMSFVGCSHSDQKLSPIKNFDTILPAAAQGQPLKPCASDSRDGDTCLVLLKEVRPTQFGVGLRDVQRKRDSIEAARKSGEKLAPDFFPKPGLAVKGPEDVFYLVDGHHRARALRDAGEKDFRVRLVADYSQLSMAEFWSRMIDHKMVWLFDVAGKGPHSPLELPDSLTELADDPYRTLAEDAQDRGANKKTDLPFQEFYWADFYRTRIAPELLDDEYERAVQEALKLAKTPAANGLPGYDGP